MAAWEALQEARSSLLKKFSPDGFKSMTAFSGLKANQKVKGLIIALSITKPCCIVQKGLKA
jgi:hypothetical protein